MTNFFVRRFSPDLAFMPTKGEKILIRTIHRCMPRFSIGIIIIHAGRGTITSFGVDKINGILLGRCKD